MANPKKRTSHNKQFQGGVHDCVMHSTLKTVTVYYGDGSQLSTTLVDMSPEGDVVIVGPDNRYMKVASKLVKSAAAALAESNAKFLDRFRARR